MTSEIIKLGKASPDGLSFIEQHPITASNAVFDSARQQYLDVTLAQLEANGGGGTGVGGPEATLIAPLPYDTLPSGYPMGSSIFYVENDTQFNAVVGLTGNWRLVVKTFKASPDYTAQEVIASAEQGGDNIFRFFRASSDIADAFGVFELISTVTQSGSNGDLVTNEKLTLVGAINEVHALAVAGGGGGSGGGSAEIGTLTDLTTTAQDNLVNALNEVNAKADLAFQEADNGKQLINHAVVGKNGSVPPDATYQQLADAINLLPTGALGTETISVNKVRMFEFNIPANSVALTHPIVPPGDVTQGFDVSKTVLSYNVTAVTNSRDITIDAYALSMRLGNLSNSQGQSLIMRRGTTGAEITVRVFLVEYASGVRVQTLNSSTSGASYQELALNIIATNLDKTILLPNSIKLTPNTTNQNIPHESGAFFFSNTSIRLTSVYTTTKYYSVQIIEYL